MCYFLSLVFVARTYDHLDVVLNEHADKIGHRLFGWTLRRHIFVIVIVRAANYIGVYVVAARHRFILFVFLKFKSNAAIIIFFLTRFNFFNLLKQSLFYFFLKQSDPFFPSNLSFYKLKKIKRWMIDI